MIIALDYDDTFTKDMEAWTTFCALMQARGHTIYGVTFRYSEGYELDTVDPLFFTACDEVFFTGRTPKRAFMTERGKHVNVWIDDCPDLIVGGLTPHKVVHHDDETIAVQHTGAVNEGINWDTLWYIKNEIWGEEAEAIELYPAKSRLVNNAPVRHLWRVPDGITLPDLIDGGWPKPDFGNPTQPSSSYRPVQKTPPDSGAGGEL